MAARFLVFAAAVVAVTAAPPAQQRYPAPQLDYYLEQAVDNYYRPAEHKQVSANGPHNHQAARLESLEPDSEVELVPGVQQPQQPPQQNPVAPNVPGLLPGQRVFIVHMPVPGYSPGSIGGYQPIYIVAAAPQGNARFPGNGFQNTVLVDPSGQEVVNPFVGYNRGYQPQVLGAAPLAYPYRPYELVYQNPTQINAAGQQVQSDAARGPVQFAQNAGLQVPLSFLAYPGSPANVPAHNTRVSNGPPPAQLKQAPASDETKEAVDAKTNQRAQALTRNKA